MKQNFPLLGAQQGWQRERMGRRSLLVQKVNLSLQNNLILKNTTRKHFGSFKVNKLALSYKLLQFGLVHFLFMGLLQLLFVRKRLSLHASLVQCLLFQKVNGGTVA